MTSRKGNSPSIDGSDDNPFVAKFDRLKAQSMGQVLIKAARLFNEEGIRRLGEGMPDSPIRGAHLSLFAHIDWQGTRTSEIAKRLGITKQAVGQLVSDLEGLDILARKPDPSDGRAKLVFITAHGQEELKRGIGVLMAVEASVREAIGAERCQRLLEDLTEVVDFFEGEAGENCDHS